MRIRSIILRFRQHTDGNAALEFALLLPILLFLVVGTFDLGRSIHTKLTIQSAISSGMLHATWTQGEDLAGTVAVVRHDLGALPIDIESDQYCTCTNGSPCKNSCPVGNPRHVYVRATHSGPHNIFLPDIDLSAGFDLYVGRMTK